MILWHWIIDLFVRLSCLKESPHKHWGRQRQLKNCNVFTINLSYKQGKSLNLYITKSWSIAFIIATLQLSHVIIHVIFLFLFFVNLLPFLKECKIYDDFTYSHAPIEPHHHPCHLFILFYFVNLLPFLKECKIYDNFTYSHDFTHSK